MLVILIGVCAVLGLAVGSFLNVVIFRVPRHQSVISPPSACPSCHTPIASRDNIPVVSWVLLRGRCRSCHAAIPVRYPLIELGTAGLFASVAARLGYNWALPAYLVLFAGLLALSCIDVEFMLLPKKIVYPLLLMVAALLVVASAGTKNWHHLLVAVLCAAGWLIVFFALNAISPRLLGFGDVRLAPVLGLSLGWLGVGYTLLGFFAANLIGAVVGIFLLATKRIARQQQIPYGVFLALGTALAFFAGPELLSHFSRLS